MNRGLLIATVAALFAPALGQAQGVEIERGLEQRYFVAEVPPGATVQVGVKMPRDALIAETKVFVDTMDKGEKMDWSACDVDTKKCKIGDARIIGYHRVEAAKWEQLAVDVKSTSDQVRYAKIQVNFQPQSGSDESGCEDVEKCGFSKTLESR